MDDSTYLLRRNFLTLPLVNKGPANFSQYLVVGWRVEAVRDETDINKNKIKVTTVLRRRITSIFLGYNEKVKKIINSKHFFYFGSLF